jgi:hypothetical protein
MDGKHEALSLNLSPTKTKTKTNKQKKNCILIFFLRQVLTMHSEADFELMILLPQSLEC